MFLGLQADEKAKPSMEERHPSTINEHERILPPVEAVRNAIQERVARWTTSPGLRYDAMDSYDDPDKLSRSSTPEGDVSPLANSSSKYWRDTGVENIVRSSTHRVTNRDRPSYIENSDDEEYWSAAPFGPRKSAHAMSGDLSNCFGIGKAAADSPESAPSRQLYRYSTRRELTTRYRGSFLERKDSEPCSEDVMQAARCLVSMKSRTSV
jgi:hypothetical protein